MVYYNIISFNGIYVFDITLDSTKVQLRGNLAGGDDKTSMVILNKICKNIRFYILQSFINISNVIARQGHEF